MTVGINLVSGLTQGQRIVCDRTLGGWAAVLLVEGVTQRLRIFMHLGICTQLMKEILLVQ